MKTMLLALLLALAAAADGRLLPPCCPARFQIPFATLATSPLGHFAQRQEHHPGTCNNYRGTEKPCACHNATTCPDYDDQGREIPRGEDQQCQQYCDREDCKCVGPCDT